MGRWKRNGIRREKCNKYIFPWQTSVSKWYQSKYDISRHKSIVLQCYALKQTSESCLSLCEVVEKTIRPTVKELYVHFKSYNCI